MRELSETQRFWVDILAVLALGLSLVLSFPRAPPPDLPAPVHGRF